MPSIYQSGASKPQFIDSSPDCHEFFAYLESNMTHPAYTQRRCLSMVVPVKPAAVVGKDE